MVNNYIFLTLMNNYNTTNQIGESAKYYKMINDSTHLTKHGHVSTTCNMLKLLMPIMNFILIIALTSSVYRYTFSHVGRQQRPTTGILTCELTSHQDKKYCTYN